MAILGVHVAVVAVLEADMLPMGGKFLSHMLRSSCVFDELLQRRHQPAVYFIREVAVTLRILLAVPTLALVKTNEASLLILYRRADSTSGHLLNFFISASRVLLAAVVVHGDTARRLLKFNKLVKLVLFIVDI